MPASVLLTVPSPFSPHAAYSPGSTSPKAGTWFLLRHKAPAQLNSMGTAPNAGNLAAKERRCRRSEEHTSELQSLMRTSYAVFCLKKKHQQKSSNQLAHSTT